MLEMIKYVFNSIKDKFSNPVKKSSISNDPELCFKPMTPLEIYLIQRSEPMVMTPKGCIAPCNCTTCEPVQFDIAC